MPPAISSKSSWFSENSMANPFIRYLALGVLTCAPAVVAQVNITGVSNGADFSATVAPGSLASVFGSGLAPATATLSVPFPTSVSGVSISVNGRPAPITYLSPAQINFQVPADAADGNYNLLLNQSGTASNKTILVVKK